LRWWPAIERHVDTVASGTVSVPLNVTSAKKFKHMSM